MSFAILTGERWLATCRNIGLGGAFIETPEPMSVGAGVVVYLPLPEFVEPVRIASTVRWTTSEGFGVQFGVMGVRETRGLMSLIYPS